MKTAKKREPVDISKIKLEQISPFQNDTFIVRTNEELTFEDFADFINDLYRKQPKSNSIKPLRVNANGDGLTFLISTEESPILELTLAGAQESKYLAIERTRDCTLERFRDFYNHCQREVALHNPTIPDYSI